MNGALALPPPAKTWPTTRLGEALQAAERRSARRAGRGSCEHVYGGGKTISSSGGGCTTAFSVFEVATGTTGVLTAGHCPNDRFYEPDPDDAGDEIDMDWIDGHRGPWGDVQWHTTDNHTDYAEFYSQDGDDEDDADARRDVEGYISGFSQGDYVCKYGRTTSYGWTCTARAWTSPTTTASTSSGSSPSSPISPTTATAAAPGSSSSTQVESTTGGTRAHRLKRSLFSRITYADNALPGIGLLVDPLIAIERQGARWRRPAAFST